MVKEKGIFYLRTTREKTPVIYSSEENFQIGGSKVHKSKIQNPKSKVLILTAGVTLFEAFKAQKELAKDIIECTVVDCYCIKPLDEETIRQQAAENNLIVIVEDHYPYGGLGDAVREVLDTANVSIHHLCVRKIPRSGKSEELLRFEEIDFASIVKKVKDLVK